MENIVIDNRDTENIHIDTYQMFTGNSTDEYTIESEIKHTGDTSLTYDSFEWEYNHKQIVEDLAHASINIIEQAIAHTDYSKIMNGIKYVNSGSPKFYNYTTDWYTMSIEVNEKELHKYIVKNKTEIVEIAETYDSSIVDGEISQENYKHAAICHILNNCITSDDYNMDMWELEMEIYMNNTEYTQVKQ